MKKNSTIYSIPKLIMAVVYYLSDSLFLLFLNIKNINKVRKTNNTILFIRMDNIGDIIMWSHSIESIREKYPKNIYTLKIICNESCADYLKLLDIFDAIILINRRKFVYSPFYRMRKLYIVYSLNTDIAINPTSSREFFWADSLIRFSFNSIKIGISGINDNAIPFFSNLSDKWYSNLFNLKNYNKNENTLNNKFMNLLGIKVKHSLNKTALNSIKNEKINTIEGKFFVICPGASWSGRRWSAFKFKNLAERILDHKTMEGVICGAKSDESIAKYITDNKQIALLDLTGKTSISEYIDIIRKASLLITNESSALQIGLLTNTPTVCIIGGGHYGRFTEFEFVRPGNLYIANVFMSCYGCNWNCKFNRAKSNSVKCIHDVSVDDVYELIEYII